MAVALSSLLAGCMTDQAPTPATTAAAEMPSMSRADAGRLIAAQKSSLWKDAPSIRDAKLSDPIICPARDLPNLPAAPGSTCACVEVNAKNSYGGYAGLHRTVVIFAGGNELSTSDAGIKGFSAICDANMTPFPDINGDYIEPKPGKKLKRQAS